MEKWIETIIDKKIELLNSLKKDKYLDDVVVAGNLMAAAIKNGNKIMVAGNGGSACDAQHLVGELVGRFLIERNPMPAITLGTDIAVTTSISNDYGFDDAFARQLMGLGVAGDIFVGISTSGNSENILRAAEVAKIQGMKTIGLLGKDGGKIAKVCDISLIVPENHVPRIQEIHTLTVHILCEMIEKEINS